MCFFKLQKESRDSGHKHQWLLRLHIILINRNPFSLHMFFPLCQDAVKTLLPQFKYCHKITLFSVLFKCVQ